MRNYKVGEDVGDLGLCDICKYLREKNHPVYYCMLNKDWFGEVQSEEDCSSFEDGY